MLIGQRLWTGFLLFFKASSFVTKNKKIIWYLIPIAMYVFLFVFAFWGISAKVTPLIENWIKSKIGTTNPPADLNWWKSTLNFMAKGGLFLVSYLIKILVFLVLGRFMKYLVLIVLSPFLAIISEKTEEVISGKTFPFDILQLLKDVLRGVLFALRNIIVETLCIILVAIACSFMPFLAIIAAPFLILVNSFYMGVSFMDYVAERQKLGVGASMQYMRKAKWELIGIGLGFNLVWLIPFLSMVIGPVNGTIAAVKVSQIVPFKEI